MIEEINTSHTPKSQQIELAPLQEWLCSDKARLTYASQSGRINKKLQINSQGTFIIVHNGEDVFQTMQPFAAVEKYNSL